MCHTFAVSETFEFEPAAYSALLAGGVFVLGQDQVQYIIYKTYIKSDRNRQNQYLIFSKDLPGGGFDRNQAFSGRISDVGFWADR